MSKRTKKNSPKCDRYLFSLKPLHNYCKFSQIISVSFCDASKHRRQKQSTDQNDQTCLDCPVFNKDNNFATPTFILHSEKQHFELQGEKMRGQHEKKMIEYTDEKESLNLPKPRSKNSFCNVCRQTYDDYLSHIQSENHKKCIRNSNFNKFILELVDKYNPSQKSSLNFSQNTHSTQDQDDVEIIQSKPRKKVKPLEEDYQRAYQCGITSQIAPPPHLNLGHTAYFPSNYQNFTPNSMYNFLYTFNNYPTIDANFNNQTQVQNQMNFGYLNQSFNLMGQWQNQMAQYQRNFIEFQAMNHQGTMMGQNYAGFNKMICTGQNQGIRSTNQRQYGYQQKIGLRKGWDEEKIRQRNTNQTNFMNQINQMNQLNQMHQLNQMNQVNQMNQFNQMNPFSQMNQFNQMNGFGQMNNQMNYLNQMNNNEINGHNQINSQQKMNALNQMNQQMQLQNINQQFSQLSLYENGNGR